MSRIRANTITNQNANGAPNFPDGLTVSGIVTATVSSSTLGSLSVTGDATVGGTLGIGGTLTYEDVTNIDSVGLVTARSGIKIGPTAGVAATIFSDGSINTTGIITATTVKVGSAVSMTDGAVSATRFHGNGAQLTGIVSGILQVKQVRFTGTQATTSSYANISGLSITMTPTNVNTQMLVIMSLATYHANGNSQLAARIDGAGGYESGDMWSPGSGVAGNITQFILDDHNSTSAQTYTAQFKHEAGGGDLNKDYNGSNNGISTFTVIEIDSSVIV